MTWVGCKQDGKALWKAAIQRVVSHADAEPVQLPCSRGWRQTPKDSLHIRGLRLSQTLPTCAAERVAGVSMARGTTGSGGAHGCGVVYLRTTASQ